MHGWVGGWLGVGWKEAGWTDGWMGREVGTRVHGRMVWAGWLAAGSLVFSRVLVDQSRHLTG